MSVNAETMNHFTAAAKSGSQQARPTAMYYLAQGEQQLGPYSVEQVTELLRNGQISPTNLAWREGMETWIPLQQVLGNLTSTVLPAPPLYKQGQQAQLTPFQPSYAAASSTLLMPPSLHWALVLLFGFLSSGIFFVVWWFIQASWAKKINPKDNSTLFLILATVAWVMSFFVYFVSFVSVAVMGEPESLVLGIVVYLFLSVGSSVFFVIADFRIRRTMLDFFNSVEPINLQMNAAMTFFFNTLYLQHHMTRIANWKKTGKLG